MRQLPCMSLVAVRDAPGAVPTALIAGTRRTTLVNEVLATEVRIVRHLVHVSVKQLPSIESNCFLCAAHVEWRYVHLPVIGAGVGADVAGQHSRDAQQSKYWARS